MRGPCLCGDTYCPSCGPLLGNSRCEVCGMWDADGGCADPEACARLANERAANEYAELLEERALASGIRLCHEAGEPVSLGDSLTNFRGTPGFIVTGWHEPHKPGSTGRVFVRTPNGTDREFFPGVFNLIWRPANAKSGSRF